MYVNTNTLPNVVKRAMESVKYFKSDIEVIHTNSVTPNIQGNDGQKGFCILIDLNTDKFQTLMGSWGGANMFNRDNVVDLDNTDYPLNEGMVVIKGTMGYPSTWARIYAHQGSSILPLPTNSDMTDKEMFVLSCYVGLKSFARNDEMLRWMTDTEITQTVTKLIESGHIKANKAGATQITTQGKNAVGDKRPYHFKF